MKGGNMSYKVHRVDVNKENIKERLEQFLNTLDGEIISVIPNVRPTFQLMGAPAKLASLFIVEKVGK